MARKALAAGVVGLLVLAVSAFAASPAEAAPLPSLTCGVNPTTDVVLTTDLTCSVGFTVTAPITIDLQGHRLTVPGPAGGCQTSGPCGAVSGAKTVRNGQVFGTLHDIGTVEGLLIVGDVRLRPASARNIGPISVHHTLIYGQVFVFGSDVSIDNNLIQRGILVDDSGRAVRNLSITRNWVFQAPAHGIEVDGAFGNFPMDISGTIASNIIVRSAGNGIEIGGSLFNYGALAITSNLVMGNGGHGIHTGSTGGNPGQVVGGPVTITDNSSIGNGGQGINAQWIQGFQGSGVADGGNNRALNNTATPACTGVVCAVSAGKPAGM